MNFKKIFAGIAAASVAVSTLAVSAFAETKIIEPNDPGVFEEGYFDIYFGELDYSILDDVTELNGAVSITVNFEVSDFEDYGEEFAVYAYYYQIDWDQVDFDWDYDEWEAFEESEYYKEGFGEDVVITEDGTYSAVIELDEPLEVDEALFYLGLWSDDNWTSSPVIELINLEVEIADDDDTTNDDDTTSDDDTTNDDDDAAEDDTNTDNGVDGGDDEGDNNEGSSGTDVTTDTTVTSEDKTVTVTGDIPEGTVVKVVPAEVKDGQASFEITLVDADGKEVKPNGEVTVSITVPEELADAEEVFVYYKNDEGKIVEEMEVISFKDGVVSFKTTHFSVYVVSTEELEVEKDTGNTDNSGNDNDKGNPETGVVLALVPAAAAAAGVIISKKRK